MPRIDVSTDTLAASASEFQSQRDAVSDQQQALTSDEFDGVLGSRALERAFGHFLVDAYAALQRVGDRLAAAAVGLRDAGARYDAADSDVNVAAGQGRRGSGAIKAVVLTAPPHHPAPHPPGGSPHRSGGAGRTTIG